MTEVLFQTASIIWKTGVGIRSREVGFAMRQNDNASVHVDPSGFFSNWFHPELPLTFYEQKWQRERSLSNSHLPNLFCSHCWNSVKFAAVLLMWTKPENISKLLSPKQFNCCWFSYNFFSSVSIPFCFLHEECGGKLVNYFFRMIRKKEYQFKGTDAEHHCTTFCHL